MIILIDNSRGCTWLVENLGFKATQNRSFLRLTRDMENLGIVTSTSSTRESISYNLSFPKDDKKALNGALETLVETLVIPRMEEWEFREDCLNVMSSQLQAHSSCPHHLLSGRA